MAGAIACRNEGVRHFNPEEEEALSKDPSTSQILDKVRTHAGIGGPAVEVRGDDKTWRETKEAQRGHVGVSGGVHVAHAAFEAVHFAELHAIEAMMMGTAAGAAVSLSAVAGFGLGVYALHEAHVHGEEQNAALTKDELHVAMLVQLELPQGYKDEQLALRSQAGQSHKSATQRMTSHFLTADKPLCAAMQLHADRGMNAGRDCILSGLPTDKFLAQNPRVAEAYAKDAAFRDGFDSLLWAKEQTASPALYKETVSKLDDRNCWYAQASVTLRM